jgi:hypothetical protein
MVRFSNDVDILKYEPILFGELHLPGQILIARSGGTLSGTTFTASGADFLSASVTAGQVIYLQSEIGPIDGAYEIVSVDSATTLTVSVIRTDPNDEPIAPPAATNISYRISTFGPQAGEIGLQLTEYFGVRPGNPTSDIEAEYILDMYVLKTTSVFAVISSVYATLANSTENENLWKKSLHYQKLFEKARERCRLSIDVDGDNMADTTKSGASRKLMRD